jgi:uncharacterized phage-associated protein
MFDRLAGLDLPQDAPPTPYAHAMVVSARDVAAVLRQRLPGLPTKKLHKLLYYCQGHHLATFDEPLFRETISAWDMGPVVGTLWYAEKRGETPTSQAELTEAQLNTVGYVLSRYGALTGLDLENLTHSEGPWQRANHDRRPGESARMESEWIKDYFSTSGTADDPDDGAVLDSTDVSTWLQEAATRHDEVLQPDTTEELRARLTQRV